MDEDTETIRNYLEDLKFQAIENCEQNLPTDEHFNQLTNKLSSKKFSKLSYKDYVDVRNECNPSLKKYLKTSAFLQSPKCENGSIFCNEIST